ncbi:MAG TPA: ATP-binding protein [Casimicrobiaceae bacterium]|nr:ATP-binding protein [Casimicrobiaceae bacterium]
MTGVLPIHPGTKAPGSARALAAALLVLASLAARAAGAAPGVLILHSNQRPTPAQVVIEDTLRTVVPQGFKAPVQIFSEYLDDEWASLETYGAAEAEFLAEKYRRRDIRVIVADALPALQFTAKFRDRMFPGLPVVHIAVARDRLEGLALPRNVVGNTENQDPTPTLQLALRLHPGATRLVVIRGASERDRLWDARVRAAIEHLGNGLEVEYLNGLPTAEVLRRVGALSPGALVFTPGYFSDGAGEVSTPRQSVERIARASTVPVYGTFDTLLGTGIVGGYMTRYEDQAKEAGAIVVRLLNGAAATEIAPESVVRVPMFDWHQLRRWGIDERLLPADAIVTFREPTLWDRYWPEISAGVAILLFQAGLIAVLLVERRSRRRMATALEESEKRMSLAARAARLSMWIWDVARDKIWATTYPRQRADMPNELPATFEDVLEMAHPADREDLDQAVRKALATGEELDIEYRVELSGGDLRWIAARGRTEPGNGQRMLGVAVDITERKLAELRAAEDRAALRHMSRVSMLGQLSASIAHQLNQPLAAILGNAEAARKMLARERVDLAELREICDDIVADDNRAAEVIRRLGALYRRGDMKMEPLDLNELIRETLDLLRAELLIRHVAPRTDLALALPMIDGGRVQLQQVLLNLVLNAADAVSGIVIEKRSLAIRTEAAGAAVRLFVVDNGSGIVEGDLGHVFDAFWSTKDGGMGIGLAICKSIVAAHYGNITVANNAEGGATFCISLPAGLHA